MTHLITARQQLILDVIRDYIERTGYAPSVRDIAAQANIKSPQGALRHLQSLEKKGYIARDSKARSIRLLDPTAPQPQAGVKPILKTGTLHRPEATSSPTSQFTMLPVVGRVAAGIPITAVEDIEEYVAVSDSLLPRGAQSFLLRVRGDSMKDGIQPNDLIIVTPGLECHRSEIVVALIDDEATVKRFYPEPDCVILRADNPRYADIVVHDNLSLVGKVTGLIRQY